MSDCLKVDYALTMPTESCSETPAAAPASGERSVVIHHHLFKNAGTSVDAVLRRNFGDRWMPCEFGDDQTRYADPATLPKIRDALLAVLTDHPKIIALSSHTLPPLPASVEGIRLLPIIFIRHPLDRIRSAYEFERKQIGVDTIGTRAAQNADFAEYVRRRLANTGDRFCRNAQTWWISLGDTDLGSWREKANRVIDQLHFIGSVEEFDRSIEALGKFLQPNIPDFRAFPAFENASRPHISIDARLAALGDELGRDLLDQLTSLNADDLDLYDRARSRYR